MPKRTVHFEETISVSVEVDVDDNASTTDIIEEALEQGVDPLCFQCSGYGEQFTREDDGELIAVEVTDADGEQLWRKAQDTTV